MKIKSLLIGMLASTAFVACTNEDDVVNNEQAVAGKAENYVAVNIVMPEGVQGRADVYDAGTDAEGTISGAVFFFFDANGNGCATPYYVDGKQLTWNPATGVGQDKKATVLVIDNDKQVPAYIAAILNPVNGEKHGYTIAKTLSDLRDDVDAYSTKGFVMTNSVYVGANGKEVCATPVTLDNIFSDPDDAKASPVTIPVERVVAKVTVTGLEDTTVEGKTVKGAASNWTTTEKFANETDMNLKLVVTGWEVLQNKQSKLFKEINTTWNLGWDWNAASLQRSFWAADYTAAGRTEYNVENMKSFAAKYVEETVSQTPNATAEANTNPYLLVRGYFADKTTGDAVELVEWRGQKYTKEGYLNFIVGNSKVAQYHTATTTGEGEDAVTTYNSIAVDALEMQDQENDWQSKAVLTTEAKAETYYTLTYNADGTVKNANPVEISVVEAAVAQFGLVQYWNGGNTYYFTPIKHETVGEGENAQNYYAVVRNHMYNVTINGIEGFGTPVANPNQAIDKPEKPTDDKSYLAADVVVLKWKVVNQSVTLK